MSVDEADDPRDVGAKGPDAFRTISEVAEDLGLPQHVLRFWETRFPQIKPIKRGGGRRYYRPGDVELLRGVKQLLYGQGYTIRGVQRILKEQGGRRIAQAAGAGDGTGRPVSRPVAAGPELFAPTRRELPPQDVSPSLDVAPAIRPPEAPEPAPSAPEPRAPETVVALAPRKAGLSQAQAGALVTALDELKACRRLLDGRS